MYIKQLLIGSFIITSLQAMETDQKTSKLQPIAYRIDSYTQKTAIIEFYDKHGNIILWSNFDPSKDTIEKRFGNILDLSNIRQESVFDTRKQDSVDLTPYVSKKSCTLY